MAHSSRLFSPLLYSLLLHSVAFGFLYVNPLPKTAAQKIYTIDFFAESGGKPASAATVDVPIEEPPARTMPEDIAVPQASIKKKKSDAPSKNKIPMVPQLRDLGASKSASSVPSVGSLIGEEGTGTSGIAGIGIGAERGAGNFPYTWYVETLRKKLDENWKLNDAGSQKQFVKVGFTILRNGSIENVEVEESSGNEIYDRAARRAVEYSAPLPPLPKDYPDADLRVHVKFTLKH